MNFEFFSLTSLLVRELIEAANNMDEERYATLFQAAVDVSNEENQ